MSTKKTASGSKLNTHQVHPFGYALNKDDYREPWRIFRIMSEFVEGYQFLSDLKNEITIMGSARFAVDSEYYTIARHMGKLLGEKKFTVITGGGPGIMEAANRGAHETGAQSIGLNIQLPFEQVLNFYTTKSTSFFYFFTRKVMLTSPANAFVYFPGGFGTMDEFFEVVDFIDLGFITRTPIVLLGKKYWQPLLNFIAAHNERVGEPMDMSDWHVVDTPEQAMNVLSTVEDRNENCHLEASSFNCEGNIDWKIFRIMAELVEGFEFVSGLKKTVTVLGTRSIQKNGKYYESAHRLGGDLVKAGFSVLTGGGSGVAEAANRGAFEHGGNSYGIAMQLRGRSTLNSYLSKSIQFSYPFTRKLILTTPTTAFIFYPGGFGTLHQLFEVLTLIQTKKMTRVPVILVDHDFWGPLHQYIKEIMVHDVDTIADEDDELYQIVDSEASALRVIADTSEQYQPAGAQE